MAEEVVQNPRLFAQLLDGLREPDDVIRGRAAHALERVSCANQDAFRGLMPELISLSMRDRVPMVRWHLVMIFGNTAFAVKDIESVVSAPFQLVTDESVFVRSWAISSLCIIGKRDKRRRKAIIGAIKHLQDDESVAVRVKTAKALRVLQNENEPLPAGWSKTRAQRSCLTEFIKLLLRSVTVSYTSTSSLAIVPF